MDLGEALADGLRALVVDRFESLEYSLQKLVHIKRTISSFDFEQKHLLLDQLLHERKGALDVGDRLAVVRLPDFEIVHSLLQTIECGPFLCPINQVRTNTIQ